MLIRWVGLVQTRAGIIIYQILGETLFHMNRAIIFEILPNEFLLDVLNNPNGLKTRVFQPQSILAIFCANSSTAL